VCLLVAGETGKGGEVSLHGEFSGGLGVVADDLGLVRTLQRYRLYIHTEM